MKHNSFKICTEKSGDMTALRFSKQKPVVMKLKDRMLG